MTQEQLSLEQSTKLYSKVYVVSCIEEFSYSTGYSAANMRLIGVYRTKEQADEMAHGNPTYRVDEMLLQ